MKKTITVILVTIIFLTVSGFQAAFAVEARQPVSTEGTTVPLSAADLSNLEPITKDNIEEMRMLGRFSEGSFNEELAVSPDGIWLAVAGNGGVVVYDAKSGEREKFFPTQGAVRTLAISPDSKMIAYIEMIKSDESFNGIVEASLKDMRIYKPKLTVRSLSDGMLVYEIPLYGRGCGEYQAWNLQYSADSSRLVFNDTFSLIGYESANNLCVLDSGNGDLLRTISTGGLKIRSFALSAQNPPVAWVSTVRESGKGETYQAEINILKYNLETGMADVLTSFPSNDVIERWMILTADEKHLVIGASLVRYISSETGIVEAEFVRDEGDRIVSASMAADGESIAFGTDRGSVAFYSFPQAEKMQEWNKTLPGDEEWPMEMLDLAFSPDGETVYALQNSNFVDKPVVVSAFRREGWLELFQLSGRNTTDRFPALSADGTMVAFGGYENGEVQLWSVKTGDLLHIMKGASKEVIAEAFSSDSTQLATGSVDGLIRLWNVADGSLQLTIAGHVGQVWALSFTNDGSRLLSVGADSSLKIWDPQDGSLLNTFGSGTADWQVTRLLPDLEDQTVWIASGCPHPLSCPAGGEGDLRRINLENGTIVSIQPGSTYSISFSADHTVYAKDGMPNGVESGIVHEDGSLITGAIYTSPFGNGALMGSAISADGSVLFSGNGMGLQAFDASMGLIKVIDLDYAGNAYSGSDYGTMEMGYGGRLLLLSAADGTISLWGVPGR